MPAPKDLFGPIKNKNVNKAKKKLENGIMATEENIQFHQLLANASKNHVFLIVAESISTVLGNFLRRIGPDTETSNRETNSYHFFHEPMTNGDLSIHI